MEAGLGREDEAAVIPVIPALPAGGISPPGIAPEWVEPSETEPAGVELLLGPAEAEAVGTEPSASSVAEELARATAALLAEIGEEPAVVEPLGPVDEGGAVEGVGELPWAAVSPAVVEEPVVVEPLGPVDEVGAVEGVGELPWAAVSPAVVEEPVVVEPLEPVDEVGAVEGVGELPWAAVSPAVVEPGGGGAAGAAGAAGAVEPLDEGGAVEGVGELPWAAVSPAVVEEPALSPPAGEDLAAAEEIEARPARQAPRPSSMRSNWKPRAGWCCRPGNQPPLGLRPPGAAVTRSRRIPLRPKRGRRISSPRARSTSGWPLWRGSPPVRCLRRGAPPAARRPPRPRPRLRFRRMRRPAARRRGRTASSGLVPAAARRGGGAGAGGGPAGRGSGLCAATLGGRRRCPGRSSAPKTPRSPLDDAAEAEAAWAAWEAGAEGAAGQDDAAPVAAALPEWETPAAAGEAEAISPETVPLAAGPGELPPDEAEASFEGAEWAGEPEAAAGAWFAEVDEDEVEVPPPGLPEEEWEAEDEAPWAVGSGEPHRPGGAADLPEPEPEPEEDLEAAGWEAFPEPGRPLPFLESGVAPVVAGPERAVPPAAPEAEAPEGWETFPEPGTRAPLWSGEAGRGLRPVPGPEPLFPEGEDLGDEDDAALWAAEGEMEAGWPGAEPSRAFPEGDAPGGEEDEEAWAAEVGSEAAFYEGPAPVADLRPAHHGDAGPGVRLRGARPASSAPSARRSWPER